MKQYLSMIFSLSFFGTNPATYHVRLPSPGGGPFPCLCLTTPNLGHLAYRLCTKKGIQGKDNQNKTTCVVAPMAITFLFLIHRLKQELLGGIHHSKLTSFGRFLLPWLGVSANEAMIRNLSTLEDIAESNKSKTTLKESHF